MATLTYHDPCLARRLCAVQETKPGKDDSDIVTYEEYEAIKKIGDGEEDFIIEKKVREVSRVNRQAWIAKDAPDVGVMNILQKVRRSGDFTLFNQTHNVFEASGEFDSLGRPLAKLQDYTSVPGSVAEALDAVAKGQASYEILKGVLGDLSYADMAALTPEQLTVLINDKVSYSSQGVEEGDNK